MQVLLNTETHLLHIYELVFKKPSYTAVSVQECCMSLRNQVFMLKRNLLQLHMLSTLTVSF